MSLSDRFRSLLKKPGAAAPANEEAAAPPAPETAPVEQSIAPVEPPALLEPPTPSPTLEELEQEIVQERADGQEKQQSLDRELHNLKTSLEKLEITAKSSRETQNESLQFLQQDAEREIKFFERKLQEDMTHWDKQLREREKSLEQALRQGEAGHLERKSSAGDKESAGREAAERTEALLKEQEAKLLEERQKWRDLSQAKENELLALKQDLERRETDLQAELKQQEMQRKAAQELWQTRLKELERQSTEKRRIWEESMKAKEEERLRLHTSFQEKQAAWLLEQERRVQDVTRRQERAQEKLSALKAHLVKETQNWQQLSQTKDEQIQQLKVKLLLSESESKGQHDQAQKTYHESVGGITTQIQHLQRQLQQEQETWQKKVDVEDRQIEKLKEDIRTKLRHMEADFSQRMTVLNSDKETLHAEFQNVQAEYQQAQTRYTETMQKLKDEQTALEIGHHQRMAAYKQRADESTGALQSQISALERQKEEAERELEAVRLRWQQELVNKEQSLKEAQAAVGPQEAELRKKFAAEEETVNRQAEALKSRLRSLERDQARLMENLEKGEKDQAAVKQALEIDHRAKEEVMRQRAAEQATRLQKRLEERKMALEAFLLMKKDEENRVQNTLKAKEKERADLTVRLQTLPQELQAALETKKQTVQKEADAIKAKITALETELAQTREDSKAIVQAKVTDLAVLRQALEQKHKQLTSDLRLQEQVLESERAQIEKQISLGQADMDRVRSHWQEEIDKKEKDIQTLQGELRKQDSLQRAAFEAEQKTFEQQLQPLELQRQTLTDTLAGVRNDQEIQIKTLEDEKEVCQTEIQKTGEQETASKAALETRFRQERAQWKAKIAELAAQKEKSESSAQTSFEAKVKQIDQLEESIRSQMVGHEARRREIVHQATIKSRALKDIIKQIEQEIKASQETHPQQIQEREAAIAQLQETLAETQAAHKRTLARLDRALATLQRRGRQQEDKLRSALQISEEEWARKFSEREADIALLQSNLLAKETERQGELDRLGKQFAEERFQLEKTKEELEWKLKDRKDVSERQLASKQKEIQSLESDIARAQSQRDQDVALKTAAFDSDKKKLQQAVVSLQKQTEEIRQKQETALAAKEQELQGLLSRSKDHLTVLTDEFNQKVGSWRSTNDALRGQIEELKGHTAEAQNRWETIRKEKAADIAALKQTLSEWEAQIKNDSTEFERTFSHERQTLITAVRAQEKDLQEKVSEYERRLSNADEEMVRATDSIRSQEQDMEAKWHAMLEQWQIDKEALQQQKAHLEQELVDMQTRFQAELRLTEETTAKLKMDIAFKEAHASSQQERLKAQMDRDLIPLRDRLGRLTSEEETERSAWEVRLKSKDDELNMLKARLAVREKRLQDESRRRAAEIQKLQKQVSLEVNVARVNYDGERTRLEKVLLQCRESLAKLQARESELKKSETESTAATLQAMQRERQQLEESLRHVLTQREELRAHFEPLLNEREKQEESLQRTLEAKETEMQAIRDNAREQADVMRKHMEALRQTNRRHVVNRGTSNAATWTTFDAGVNYYQSQQWADAARSFEDCLQKDPRWGAAYQYLALTYFAQGDMLKAADIATKAKELDPGNTQLASWADRLFASIREQKAS